MIGNKLRAQPLGDAFWPPVTRRFGKWTNSLTCTSSPRDSAYGKRRGTSPFSSSHSALPTVIKAFRLQGLKTQEDSLKGRQETYSTSVLIKKEELITRVNTLWADIIIDSKEQTGSFLVRKSVPAHPLFNPSLSNFLLIYVTEDKLPTLGMESRILLLRRRGWGEGGAFAVT